MTHQTDPRPQHRRSPPRLSRLRRVQHPAPSHPEPRRQPLNRAAAPPRPRPRRALPPPPRMGRARAAAWRPLHRQEGEEEEEQAAAQQQREQQQVNEILLSLVRVPSLSLSPSLPLSLSKPTFRSWGNPHMTSLHSRRAGHWQPGNLATWQPGDTRPSPHYALRRRQEPVDMLATSGHILHAHLADESHSYLRARPLPYRVRTSKSGEHNPESGISTPAACFLPFSSRLVCARLLWSACPRLTGCSEQQ